MNSLLKQLSVGKRLGLGFALILVFSIFATLVGLTQLNTVATSTKTLLEEPLATERLISDWYRYIHTAIRRTAAIAKSSDPSLAAFFEAEGAESTKVSADLFKLIVKQLQSEQEIKLLKEVEKLREAYLSTRNKVVALKKEGNTDEANQLLEKTFMPTALSYVKKVEEMQALQRSQIDAMAAEIQANYERSRTLLIVLILLTTTLAIVTGWLLTRSITEPLIQATNVAQKMAMGDLTEVVDVHRNDEIGTLITAINGVSSGLSHVIADVRNGTDAINVAAAEIASGNADLSSRTESQASSLEETASSMEELTSTVKQNADNARQANQLVVTATGVAIKGGEVVDQVVETMGSIKASSNKIVDIIAVIDGIAFQTNILALNAAVEAARAGEQGRGFAVVASEVRNLAQRSASAAKEIKQLIDDSVSKVEHGSRLVDNAGSTMQEIVTSVQRVADIMSEISSASQEQSAGIEQVNMAINQMDEMTQQNAALVEEAAAAAESMREQSDNLTQVVAQFKIAAQLQTASTPVKTPARALKPATAAVRPVKAAPAPRKQITTASNSNQDWEEF
ncbi:MCP four helix bundle domain-containing protein [Undibacterium sp. FT79W]|uniref:methyl-accepting chemotaxis protein n=1 Tax=Undibacterium sp. FT79W TaxID=2762296 RepID=UPI00164BA601|nr:methyl-accepting chemotaxis protein [Undibacterium sp. FT79W]MBC3877960.1 MCP four helix bundle domain-containing protein [Undibacterium sp. FT79W]